MFGELAREDFRPLYRDNEWLFGMSLASDACFMLGDSSAAGTLYEQLFPFAGRHAVGWAAGSLGAVDRYLGLLAATLGRLPDAERHLEHAIRLNDRMGARPWTAYCRHDLAMLLLARDAPGDRERAGDLLHQALSTARGIGLVALEARIKPLLGDAPAAAPPQAGPAQRGVYRREGEYYSVMFQEDSFRLKDTKGLRYSPISWPIPAGRCTSSTWCWWWKGPPILGKPPRSDPRRSAWTPGGWGTQVRPSILRPGRPTSADWRSSARTWRRRSRSATGSEPFDDPLWRDPAV